MNIKLESPGRKWSGSSCMLRPKLSTECSNSRKSFRTTVISIFFPFLDFSAHHYLKLHLKKFSFYICLYSLCQINCNCPDFVVVHSRAHLGFTRFVQWVSGTPLTSWSDSGSTPKLILILNTHTLRLTFVWY